MDTNEAFAALGGHRAMLMIGGTRLPGGDKLVVKFKARAKSGIRSFEVRLDEATDTYTVVFWTGGKAARPVERVDLVYADALRGVVESATGLYLSLGTMGAAS